MGLSYRVGISDLKDKGLSFVWIVFLACAWGFYCSSAFLSPKAPLALTVYLIIGGIIGGVAGNMIRKFALPTSFYTREGILGILWVKLFWILGPQLVGIAAGSIAGVIFLPEFFG